MMFKTAIGCIVILIIGSCKGNYDAPCREVNTAVLNLNGSEETLWPFHVNDTLYYAASSGDTLPLLMAAFGSTYITFPMPNNPECPDDSVGYEVRHALASDSNQVFSFETRSDKYNAKAGLTISGQVYEFPYATLYLADSLATDSIIFEGRNFKNVFMARAGNGDSLYYTTTNGLVRFVSSTKSFTLIKP